MKHSNHLAVLEEVSEGERGCGFASMESVWLLCFFFSGKATSSMMIIALITAIRKMCFDGSILAKMNIQKSLLNPYNPTNITFIIESFIKINFRKWI